MLLREMSLDLPSSLLVEDRKVLRKGCASISAAILYAALAGPPLLFGSRDSMTVAAWCALLGVGLVLAPTSRLQKAHVLMLGAVAFIILCFAFVLHEQLSDHPWFAAFNPVWSKASDALNQQLVPSVSIVKGQPFFALGRPLVNILALVLGLIVGVDGERARRGTRVMAWAGVVYACYGILALLFDPTEILWREKSAYIGSLTATFINRNSAAAYFGSCSAVWLVILMGTIRRKLPRGPIEWRRVPERLLRDPGKDVLIRFIMLFVCLSAMFMTGSRGGTLISLAMMAAGFMIFFRRDLPRRAGLVTALLACAGTALLMLFVLGGSVTNRIDLLGLSDAGRLSAYRSTLRIILDNPWFGTGLGTFAYAFPAYRSNDMSMRGIWDIAHNSALELASETGIPLALIIGTAWIAALVVLSLYLLRCRHARSASLSALCVSLIALLHSLIDFSLQITGYSIVVFALLGLGLSQAVIWRDADIADGRMASTGR
jgi:O-antigen ligase